MSDENKTNLDQNVNQTSSIKKDIVYCSKCGLKNSSSSKYCSSCGNNLNINWTFRQ
ncbi:MAG: zinc-ribbon domain-containing protein [Clostridium sp.]|nr:zinc-ribbon domain-containing protein [Clostridium sp.]